MFETHKKTITLVATTLLILSFIILIIKFAVFLSQAIPTGATIIIFIISLLFIKIVLKEGI